MLTLIIRIQYKDNVRGYQSKASSFFAGFIGTSFSKTFVKVLKNIAIELFLETVTRYS